MPFIEVKTEDEEKRILKIALHDEIRHKIFPEGTDFSKITHIPKNVPLKCFLIQNSNGDDIGLVSILEFPIIKKCVCDIGCLSQFRGVEFKRGVKECLDTYFKNTGYDIYAFIRGDNKQSIYFCKSLGCKLINKVDGNQVIKYEV